MDLTGESFAPVTTCACCSDVGPLYERWRAKMLAYARSHLGAEDSADAVHNVFTNLLHVVCGKGNADVSPAYLFVALRRECHRRRAHAQRTEALQKRLEQELNESRRPRDNELEPVQLAHDDTDSALMRLPPRCAAVLRCRIEGYTYKEISTKLGITPNTVNAQLQRAKKMLRSSNESMLDQK